MMKIMKILVSPTSLARQLPELRLHIIQTYENDISIDGREIKSDGTLDDQYTILNHYPELDTIFGRKALHFLSLSFKTRISKRDLKNKVCTGTSNVVNAQIKNIRHKLIEHNIPLKIVTLGKTGYIITRPLHE